MTATVTCNLTENLDINAMEAFEFWRKSFQIQALRLIFSFTLCRGLIRTLTLICQKNLLYLNWDIRIFFSKATFCVIFSIIKPNLNSAINYQIAKVSKLKILYIGSGESIELRGAKKECFNDIL